MYFSSSILLRRSTSGYPGSSGGTSVYTGTGSSSAANATSYKDITGLSANTTYYFTCTSVASPLPNGSSYNVSAKTKENVTLTNVFNLGDTDTMYQTYVHIRSQSGESIYEGSVTRLENIVIKSNGWTINYGNKLNVDSPIGGYTGSDDGVRFAIRYSSSTEPSSTIISSLSNAYKKYSCKVGTSNGNYMYTLSGNITEIYKADFSRSTTYGRWYIVFVLDRKLYRGSFGGVSDRWPAGNYYYTDMTLS